MDTMQTLTDFSGYTKPQLQQLKNDLSVNLPLEKLVSVAAYYRTAVRRDPTLEELTILDAFVSSCKNAPEKQYISELFTNDPQVAETYADMMQKRNKLFPDLQTPPSVGDLFDLGGIYLRRAGKPSVADAFTLFLESSSLSPSLSTCRSYLTASTSRNGLRVIQRPAKPKRVGDLWILLSPMEDTDCRRYRRALEALWRTPELTREVKALHLLDCDGLLLTLCKHCEGALIDIAALTADCDAETLADALNGAHTGKYLLRVSESRFSVIARSLSRVGIRARAVAVAQKDYAIDLLFPHGLRISWDLAFLSRLLPGALYTAKLPDEANGCDASIETHPHTPTSSLYLKSDTRPLETTKSLQSALRGAVSVCHPVNGFFGNAIRTALSAVASLAACGAHYSKLTLSVSLTVPTPDDPTKLGETLAVILGIYRLQAELGLPMAASRLICREEIAHPEITVFALTSEKGLVPSRTSTEALPHVLLPQDFSASIDFAELRNQLAALANASDEEALPVLSAAYEAKDESAVTRLPERICLIPANQPEIVLLTASETPDAALLADLLRDRGAAVSVFSTEELHPLTPLTRAILGAQTLIVAPDVELPADPRLHFALRTLARANGYLLFPARDKAPDLSGAIALADGLSCEMLDQICKK